MADFGRTDFFREAEARAAELAPGLSDEARRVSIVYPQVLLLVFSPSRDGKEGNQTSDFSFLPSSIKEGVLPALGEDDNRWFSDRGNAKNYLIGALGLADYFEAVHQASLILLRDNAEAGAGALRPDGILKLELSGLDDRQRDALAFPVVDMVSSAVEKMGGHGVECITLTAALEYITNPEVETRIATPAQETLGKALQRLIKFQEHFGDQLGMGVAKGV